MHVHCRRYESNRLWRPLLIPILALASSAPLYADTLVRLQKTTATTYSVFSPAELEDLTHLGVTVLDDYGPFAIGLANDATDLSKAGSLVGAIIGPEPDAYSIDAGGIAIDIREPDRPIAGVPSDLVVRDYPKGTGLFVVKFRGPIRKEWLEALTVGGIRPIQYLHKDAYLVAASGGLARLRAFVGGPLIYVGTYHPYFKLAPGLRSANALDASTPTAIRVTLDPNQELQDVLVHLTSTDTAADIYVDRQSGTAGATLSAPPIGWRSLAAHPEVLSIEPSTVARVSDERVNQVIAGRRYSDGTPIPPTPTTRYKSWLEGLCFYNGTSLCGNLSSQIVDIMDSGIAANDDGLGTHHPDLPASRLVSPRLYFGLPNLNDNNFHGTVVAGLLGGDPSLHSGPGRTDTQGFYYDMGVAPTVRLHPSRIMSGVGWIGSPFTASTLDTIIRNAYNDGARFQNSSWYESGPAYGYTSLAQEYDRLVRSARRSTSTPDEQITVVFAAGNNFAGDSTRGILSPATAKNVITVGATALQRGPSFGGTLGGNCDTGHGIKDIAEFSRQGFVGDYNRFKPDIYAPGQNTSSARSASATRYSVCAGGLLPLPAPDGPNHPANGTSFSAPIVTGAAVLARQKIFADTAHPQCGQPSFPACPNPSPALIKAALLATTETNSSGGYNYYRNMYNLWEPTPYQGFGRLALTSLLEDPVPKAYIDEDHGTTPTNRFVQAGGYKNFTFTVADPSKAIGAVLVYSDAPAAINSTFVRVNEIDMYVMQGGYVYCDGQYGLQYATRSTGCWLPDMSNNVKRARIAPNSFTGQFTIQVVGSNVSQNAVPGMDGNAPNQDWALYVYNAIRN